MKVIYYFLLLICYLLIITYCLVYAVQRYDPTYEATKLHFDDLSQRYGNPIIVLNLIKVINITFLISSSPFLLVFFLSN